MQKIENKFIGYLIKSADKDHNVNVQSAIAESGFVALDWQPVLNSLVSNGYISMTDFETLHIYPLAYMEYVSPTKRAFLFVAKLLILTIKNVAIFGFGILSGILTAYFSETVFSFLNSLLK